jgi:hypothetical protein
MVTKLFNKGVKPNGSRKEYHRPRRIATTMFESTGSHAQHAGVVMPPAYGGRGFRIGWRREKRAQRGQVSEMTQGLAEQVEAFRTRSLAGTNYPVLWVDSLYEKVRLDGHVLSMAVQIV